MASTIDTHPNPLYDYGRELQNYYKFFFQIFMHMSHRSTLFSHANLQCTGTVTNGDIHLDVIAKLPNYSEEYVLFALHIPLQSMELIRAWITTYRPFSLNLIKKEGTEQYEIYTQFGKIGCVMQQTELFTEQGPIWPWDILRVCAYIEQCPTYNCNIRISNITYRH